MISSASDSVKASPKLVKTADIHFKVKSVQQTSEQIAALTKSFDGIVIHHLMGSTIAQSLDVRISNDSLLHVTTYNATTEITVKIPPYKREDFINQVTRMGIYTDNLKMDINDKSLAYLSEQLKLKNRSDVSFGQNKDRNGDILAFKDNMVDRQLGNLTIDDSVKRSVIHPEFL